MRHSVICAPRTEESPPPPKAPSSGSKDSTEPVERLLKKQRDDWGIDGSGWRSG